MSKPRTEIVIEEGTEGDRHDPTSFTEVHFIRDERCVTYHAGIGEHVEARELSGRRRRVRVESDLPADKLFEKLTGYTVTQCKRFLRKCDEARTRPHRMHGGMEWTDGHPGESFLRCKCGDILGSHFNKGAIQ